MPVIWKVTVGGFRRRRRIPRGGAMLARLAEQEAQLLQLLRETVLGGHVRAWRGVNRCVFSLISAHRRRLHTASSLAWACWRPLRQRQAVSRPRHVGGPKSIARFLCSSILAPTAASRLTLAVHAPRLRPIRLLPAAHAQLQVEYSRHVVPPGLPHLQRLPAHVPPAVAAPEQPDCRRA